VTAEHRYAAIAAQMLYGRYNPEEGATSEIGAMKNAADIYANAHGFALFSADLDPMAAEGLALRFVDRSVVAGEHYLYRVRVAGTPGIDTGYTDGIAGAFTPALPPQGVAAEGRDGRIAVTWDPRMSRSTAYHIERSEDAGRTWRRLNRNPIVPMIRNSGVDINNAVYNDSNVVNYRTYHYRVIGVTSFGDLTMPAEVIAYGRDLEPPPAPIQMTPDQKGPRTVRVSWKMEKAPADLAGFVVARSDSSESAAHPLFARTLPSSAREYYDTAATSREHYYTVIAVDTAGNVSRSFSAYAVIIDTTAPSTPTGLAGTIDSNGVIRLHWNLGPEENLMGYRVQWANQLDHEWTDATPKPLIDTMFVDTTTLNTLSRNIYYRVVAESDRYIRSIATKPIRIVRPDIVAPVPGVMTGVDVTDSTVTITWIGGGSEDMAKQILERRKGAGAWAVVGTFGRDMRAYNDNDVEPRVSYQYRIISIDSSGLRSAPSVAVEGRPYGTTKRAPVSGLRARYDSTSGHVVVSWEHPSRPGSSYEYLLYRGKDGAQPSAYRSVGQASMKFEDGELAGSGTYSYAVRVRTNDGGISPLSAPVTVDVKE
jgi:hypothetical protein